MTRTGQAAIDYARGRKCENCMTPGYCLQFTRQCFEVGSHYASAIDAWNGAKVRHPGDRNPPAAVPVYFATSSVYDHVCFAVSTGEIISTFNDDIRAFAGISDVERQFGGTYLGWAEDINGVTVYTATPDEGDDWLSYLSYEEQRRVLLWADNGPLAVNQIRSVVDSIKPNTDRLPDVQSTSDLTLAQSTNNNNGIHQILDILSGLTAPTGRALAIVALIVVVAAVMGVLIALYVASDIGAGALTGAAVLLGGLLGWVGGAGRRGGST